MDAEDNRVGIIERLVCSGHLAEGGDYGEGTSAKLVVIVDGAPWIENHVQPLLPWAVPALDAYHALEHLAPKQAHLPAAAANLPVLNGGLTARYAHSNTTILGIDFVRNPCQPRRLSLLATASSLVLGLADYVAIRYGKGSKKARDFYDRATRHLLRKAHKTKQESKKRKGHKKGRRVRSESSAVVLTHADDELSPKRSGP